MEGKVCASGMKWENVSRWIAVEINVLVEWRKKGGEERREQVSVPQLAIWCFFIPRLAPVYCRTPTLIIITVHLVCRIFNNSLFSPSLPLVLP